MISKTVSLITVRKAPGKIHHGLLTITNKTFPCSLGRGGLVRNKREGDGGTPIGTFRILGGYFREDRFPFPKTRLPLQAISREDGWCDDIKSPRYNRPVKINSRWRHEKMWREDHLYNICLVLDYNIAPIKRGAGSAIFLHVMPEHRGPTEGCIALKHGHMEFLLRHVTRHTMINIKG